MLSQFQKNRMTEIEQRPEFAGWCVAPAIMLSSRPPDPRVQGRPCLFCYYSQNGDLHCERVGIDEVHAHYTFPHPKC